MLRLISISVQKNLPVRHSLSAVSNLFQINRSSAISRSFSRVRKSTGANKPILRVVDTSDSLPFSKSTEANKCEPTDVIDTSDLFQAISELNEFDIRLKSFPIVTVVGPQSSGKTSLIEAICGIGLFPKGMGMSTMKPFYITTIMSNLSKIWVGGKELTSEKEACDEISRVNRNEMVKSIDIRIESPNVYNNFLTDLPGLISVADKRGGELPKQIRKMNIEHLSNPNSIPVVVHAATADPATNQAIGMINKLDRDRDSFGIITKIDMVERNSDQLLSMLSGRVHPLGYGYCGVVLRSDRDIQSGLLIEDLMKRDQQFRSLNPSIFPFGTEEMKKRLSHIQFQKIRGLIPQLVSDIDTLMSKCEASESFLDMLTSGTDNNRLIGRLKGMIEKLVGSSIERCEFEDRLEKSFGKVIHDHISKTFTRTSDSQAYVPVLSRSTVDNNIHSFHSGNHSNPTMYIKDSFKELFCFGLLSPTTTDLNSVNRAFSNECTLSCTLPLFDFVIDDPLGKKRLQWNNYLKSYFNSLLANDLIQNLVHQITVDELTQYIQGDPDTNDEITKQFTEYMVRQIGNEAYQSNIKYSISAMINIEKRPLISLVEVTRHLTQLYQKHLTYPTGFFESFSKSQNKLVVEIYSEPWNEAYLKAVADKIVENCYRNVAVNLLDMMVQRLLEMTVDMVSKKNAANEKKKVSDKISKLSELKRIIAKYMDN